MSDARWPDLAIIVGYVVVLIGVGLRFSRRQTSTEAYFVAKRAVPSWAMGLSLLATLISSVTFVAYPGSSYAGNWSLLTPGFMVIGVLALAGTVLIPFYRHVVGMSAYEYFERRFGRPTRVYASIAFLAAHFSKMGFVLYLMALTLNSITGWSIDGVIVIVALAVIGYTLVGGMEAVIWTDVIQAFITWTGVVVCLGYLLFLPPGGPGAAFRIAAEHNKFNLGSANWSFSSPTLAVLVLYGFFWYLQRYAADQTVVQRYLVAKSDRGALRGVALGALLCLPVWALFMLVGTCTWAFYQLTHEALPAFITKADQVFPHFVATHLPVGVAGVFMASLIGASMTMLASDLNSLSVVCIEDFYRLLRPAAHDARRLRVAKMIVAVVGMLAAATAVALAHMRGGALSMWFAVSAMVSGGLAGLFLLAFLSRRANRHGVYIGIVASLAVTVWAVLTKGAKPLVNLGAYNFPWDDLMIGAVGHGVLIAVGYAASLVFLACGRRYDDAHGMTLWAWLKSGRDRVR
jgi:SSS family solute:Na+ symporter